MDESNVLTEPPFPGQQGEIVESWQQLVLKLAIAG